MPTKKSSPELSKQLNFFEKNLPEQSTTAKKKITAKKKTTSTKQFPSKNEIIAIDAGQPHHSFIGELQVQTKKRRGSYGKKSTSGITRVNNRLFLVEKGKPIQLEFALPEDEGLQGAVLTGLRHLFKAEGLRHWTALLRLWSIEGGRTGRVTWTLDEHLDALGYSKKVKHNPKRRDEIARLVESLARMELVLFGPDGRERMRAPLILVNAARDIKTEDGNWRLEGLNLQTNEALYSGIRNFKTGKLGNNYWPVPPTLAQIDHVHHPYAISMGLLLAIRWRWAKNKGLNYIALKGENLVRLAGASTNPRNATRTLHILENELTELKNKNIVGYWEWEGEIDFNTIIKIYPSDWSTTLVNGERRLKEAYSEPEIPTTGIKLKEWRKNKGWTQQKLADQLSVTRQTIIRIEKKEKLSKKIITFLRKIHQKSINSKKDDIEI